MRILKLSAADREDRIRDALHNCDLNKACREHFFVHAVFETILGLLVLCS